MVAVKAATTEYKDYFAKVVTDGTAAKRLISTVHHAKKDNVNVIRLALNSSKGKDQNTYTYASRKIDNIINLDDVKIPKAHIYFTLNDFFGIRRLSGNCFAINGIVIDLDAHNIPFLDLNSAKAAIRKLLNEKFNDGTVAPPTAITDTGRGFALYYIFDRNISCKGNTKDFIKFFDFVYELMFRAFDGILKETCFTCDTSVKDRSRVFRMPDTFNYHSETYCRLYDYEGRYYTLAELVEECHLTKYIKPSKKDKNKANTDVGTEKTVNDSNKDKKGLNKSNIVDFDAYRTKSLMKQRIEFLEAFVKEKTDAGQKEEYREEVLFLYYNSLVQIMDRTEAKELTWKLNSTFLKPLPDDEVQCAFSPDNFKDEEKGIYGYYPITHEKICELLKLNEFKARELGLFVSHKKEQRAEAKQKSEEKKAKKEKIVKTIKENNPDAVRDALLILVNDEFKKNDLKPFSLKTLDRILKKLGFGRSGSLAFNETSEYKKDQARKEAVQKKKEEKQKKKVVKFPAKPEKSTVSNEFPKNAPVYCSVAPVHCEQPESVSFSGLLSDIQQKHLCPGVPDKAFGCILDAYSVLNDNNKLKADKGLTYIYDSYKELDYFYMLQYDLDNLFKGFIQNKVNITYLNVNVPVSVYLENKTWKNKPVPADVKMLADFKNKKDKKKSSSSVGKLTREEWALIEREENKDKVKTALDECNSYYLYSELPTNLINTMAYGNKKTMYNCIRYISDMYNGTVFTMDDILENAAVKFYKKPLKELTGIKPLRTEKQKKNDKRRPFWDFLYNTVNDFNADAKLRTAVRLIYKLNKDCKSDAKGDSTSTIDGLIYYNSEIRDKILYDLSVDEVKEIAKKDIDSGMTKDEFATILMNVKTA